MRVVLFVGFTLLYFGAFSQAADLNNGLITYLPFSGNVVDASSSKLKTIGVGVTLTEDRFGNKNCAYQFDGINDYITVKDMGAIFPDYISTVAFWAKALSFKSHNVYFLNTNNQNNRISGEVMYNHNGSNVCFFDHGNIGSGRLAYNQTFDREWHHYTFSSDFGNNEMKLYIDGVLVQITSSSAIFSRVNGVDMWVGGGIYFGNAGLFFHGSIDEFRIYNRVLSHEEIQLLQNLNGCNALSDTTDSSNWSLPCTTDYYQVLPNPAFGWFKIQVRQRCTIRGSAQLYNPLGQLVKTRPFIENSADFDVQDLSAGTYYVRVIDENNLLLSVKKVVIGI